ncbi:MAG: hypothetical protein OSJ69_06300 [Acetatifactor sp.]|nr:hypothetical protein [Acetatifactor sp.]
MGQQVKEFIAEIMKRDADAVESWMVAVGEFAEAMAQGILYYGSYLLAGLAVALAWLLLAATMPVWYLPYKYFTRKGAKRKCRQGNGRRYRK